MARDNIPPTSHISLWSNQADILKPYPNKPNIDVNDQMNAKGWTVRDMFPAADEFFQSLGLDPMPQVSLF
jgi:peptidyl-dipeptidase A